MKTHQDVLQAAFRVAQAWSQHCEEGGDTSSDAAHREIGIEDVEETHLGVITAGDEEPEIKSEADDNYRQQKDGQHEEEDVARIGARNENLVSIGIPEGNVK